MTTRFGRLLEALVHESVAFVVIGGVALVTQGGARATFDLDICYERSMQNFFASSEPSLRCNQSSEALTQACRSSSMFDLWRQG